MIAGREPLKRLVRAAARETPAVDWMTRLDVKTLFANGPSSIDALLTTPELIREARRYGDVRLDSEDDTERADAVFAALFIDRSPVGEHAKTVLWSLRKLGFDPGERDLYHIRRVWSARPKETRVLDALDMANLSAVAVPVELFDESAEQLSLFDDRLRAALNLDALRDADAAWPRLVAGGCKDTGDVKAFIEKAARRLEAGSLQVTTRFSGALWEKGVLPARESLGIPLIVAGDMTPGLPDADGLARRLLKEGFALIPYASGATAVGLLPGLWEQARKAIADALVEVYMPLVKVGWRLTEGEIVNDIEQLLSKAR